MLTPAYLAGASTELVELFSDVEAQIAGDIARRVVKMGRVSSYSQWQIEKARQMGMFQEGVTKKLSNATGMSKRAVNRLLAEAGMKGLESDDAIYRAAGLKPTPLQRSPALQAILLQGADDLGGLINNFTKSTLGASNAALRNLLDKTYIEIMSGAYAPNTAIQMAVRELASKGITKVAYPSGHEASIEAAVRTAVTTGVNQSVAKLQLERCSEMETKFVETSSHAGARPSHAVWQGMVFCLEGSYDGYGNFYDETGYGSGEGLCGWNCYHSFFPYFPGLSTRAFSHDPAADAGLDNDEEYIMQEKQRYYERRVREAKRQCTTIDAAVGAATSEAQEDALNMEFQQAAVLLKRREAALKSFLEESGRSRETFREQVGGFNRSVSSKAVWANRRAQRK